MDEIKKICIIQDPEDDIGNQPPIDWAIGELMKSFDEFDVSFRTCESISQVKPEEACIIIASRESAMAKDISNSYSVSVPDSPESLGVIPVKLDNRQVLLLCGSDVRGLVYAIMEIADRAIHSDNLKNVFAISSPIIEQPANPIRSIARLFTCESEDKPWFYDQDFWSRYLTMLITQRFNRFSLTLGLGYNFPRNVRDSYFYFPYPFFLSIPGYNVRAVGLSDDERDHNLMMLRYISDEAEIRGLHFQLALWTHAYEFADSPDVNYRIEGLTPENHSAYCRDALQELLETCPAINGVTFRIHGESGIPERSYDFWKTVFQGIVKCGRKVQIDMHAKGMDFEMIDVALSTGMPVNISPKYWAEHNGLPYQQASIRELERPPKDGKSEGFMALSGGSRRFLRYGYGDLLKENRKYGVLYRVWPGTQRVLLWGDPAMATGYGRYSNFCGCNGVEICEPLSFKGRMGSEAPEGREVYSDNSLKLGANDWEKYHYTYRLLGRLLYNPDGEPENWRRFLRKEFGKASVSLEEALANASRVLPLITTAHHPSASNNAYWPEIYTNMPIVDETRPHPYGDTPNPKKFGTVSSLDPELFSRINEFADELVKGQPGGKYSPIDVAQWLDGFCKVAEENLAKAEAQIANPDKPSFRRFAIDIALQIGIGKFFANKLRAGVWYALYERTRDIKSLEQALSQYGSARKAWSEMALKAEKIYVKDLTFGNGKHLRGHWIDRLATIDQDIQDMEKVYEGAKEKQDTGISYSMEKMMEMISASDKSNRLSCEHTPPASFQPGTSVEIRLSSVSEASYIRLHYRHVNQAEEYIAVDMQRKDNVYTATIPADYTNSSYPLQYFFELRNAEGFAYLYPGFNETLSNQPYYVVRQE
jgi:hypothetical protein